MAKLLIIVCFPIEGVLEADFVEPAHDKQGFERTTVLAKLEARLIQMQKTYWFVLFFIFRFFLRSYDTFALLLFFGDILIFVYIPFRSSNCHKIGYAPRRSKKVNERGNRKGLMRFNETISKKRKEVTVKVKKFSNSKHILASNVMFDG